MGWFIIESIKRMIKGNSYYYAWTGFLLLLMFFVGAPAYLKQMQDGLIVTSMRDQVSWGFYISNFTFLVGVAAAAVMLVIPAYIYHYKPIKEIVLFGEMMAVSAILMCLMFVLADMGKPQVSWHIMAKMNLPSSLLAWDVIVLNGYLLINLAAVTYILYRMACGKEYKMSIMWPIIMISIPWAVSIHTVTAFIYNGLSSRPFWNAAVLAPRFIASALCSGPALMLITFQIIRRVSKIDVSNEAIFKIAELVAYTMAVNLYLFASEFFKEFYSGSIHLAPMKFLYFGLHGHNSFVPYMWGAMACNVTAFVLFLLPKTRMNFKTLNLACVLVITGVYIEKGMGLITPGFIPDVLGEIYDYSPSSVEKQVAIGIWAAGALIYTLMIKVAIPIYVGELRLPSKQKQP